MLTLYMHVDARGTLHSEPHHISTVVPLTEKKQYYYFLKLLERWGWRE